MENPITKYHYKFNLTEITIRSYLKHFGLTIRNGFVYKKDIAIYTEDLEDREKLLAFLMGISSVLDNTNLWERK